MSSTLITDVIDCSDNSRGDVLPGLVPGGLNGPGMFSSAGQVGDMRCRDAFQLQNSWCQMANSSSSHRIFGAERSRVCSMCYESFSSPGIVDSHRRIHAGLAANTSHVCRQTYADNESLTVTHSSEQQPEAIDASTAVLPTNPHLSKQVQTHTTEKPHTCGVCRKQFSQRYLLKRHLRYHSGEKLHKCNLCYKSFNFPSRLRQHMFTHSDESLISVHSA